MRVINLASGSDGNATYIESSSKKILLDAGLSCTDIVKRLQLIDINPSELNAIVLSHEHSDHIKGVNVLSKKYNIPVYAHEDVWLGLNDKLNKIDIKNKKSFDGQFSLDELVISPVEVPHDVKCFGFSFSENNNKISVVTDLGHITDKMLNSIKGSKLVYIEANYDREMLYKGEKYPLSLKRRIDGPNGHLSNINSADVIEFLAMTGTKQVVLAHLSKENNTPNLAYTTICNKIATKGIIEGQDLHIDVAKTVPGTLFKLK